MGGPVLVIGGGRHRKRDAAGFLLGHSTGHWIRHLSSVPVLQGLEERLVSDKLQFHDQEDCNAVHSGGLHNSHVNLQTSLLSAAA